MSHKTHWIGGEWISGEGALFQSTNPATGEVLWEGAEATPEEVHRAIHSAREAFESWSELEVSERTHVLEQFRNQLEAKRDALAESLAQETGKVLWDSKGEIGAMIGKLNISIKAFEERTGEVVQPLEGMQSATRHKPHGVIAVFGPYNFPGHLPNGHIIPALLAGNTVVFKPSEQTPLMGELVMQCWEAAGLPAGVINLVQGAQSTGKALAQHPNLNGLFFTGSSNTGKILHQQFGGHPEKLLALEMGGNNPLIVHQASDLKAAAYHTIQSAYVTSGQRCTCARRLIVPTGAEGDAFIDQLVAMTKKIRVGSYEEQSEAFMGPVINNHVAQQLLDFQSSLINQGATALVEMARLKPDLPFLSPALLDVTALETREDVEHFGPLLQLIRVDSFEEAIEEANRTSYGLSAGLLSDSEELYKQFYRKSRAGIVNWNRPLTGASSGAPFGGTGISGNHNPSAYYAADYCAFPVASLEADALSLPSTLSPGLEIDE